MKIVKCHCGKKYQIIHKEIIDSNEYDYSGGKRGVKIIHYLKSKNKVHKQANRKAK